MPKPPAYVPHSFNLEPSLLARLRKAAGHYKVSAFVRAALWAAVRKPKTKPSC
jgi:hypothetical protein